MDRVEKPPLGIVPKYVWSQKRMEEILEGTKRFMSAGKEVPDEWLKEYHQLSEEAKAHQNKQVVISSMSQDERMLRLLEIDKCTVVTLNIGGILELREITPNSGREIAEAIEKEFKRRSVRLTSCNQTTSRGGRLNRLNIELEL